MREDDRQEGWLLKPSLASCDRAPADALARRIGTPGGSADPWSFRLKGVFVGNQRHSRPAAEVRWRPTNVDLLLAWVPGLLSPCTDTENSRMGSASVALHPDVT